MEKKDLTLKVPVSNSSRILSQTTAILNDYAAPEFQEMITEKDLLNYQVDLNGHFREVNSKLFIGGCYSGKVALHEGQSLFNMGAIIRSFAGISHLRKIPLGLELFSKSFVARDKLAVRTQKPYKKLTKTEIMGRLVYCGFDIDKTEESGNVLSFSVRKIKNPESSSIKATSLIFKATRIGKNGKKIKVYKLRTMYPYAAFLQSYVHKKNDLDVGGKFKSDFRISKRGRFLRKYFLDEIPMIWNVITRDIKIVGVRPISEHYLSLYDEGFRQIRSRAKPGLLPPYYVDFPDSIEKIQLSELNYLEQYWRNPWLTDIKYFFRIIYNIALGRVKSK